MRGTLNMRNNRISNLGEAIQNNDAVNKIYVDSKIIVSKEEGDKKYLVKSEGDKVYVNKPITENIDMKNKKIINSGSPEDLGDLVNKQYIDDLIEDYALKNNVDKISTLKVNKNNPLS